jgi:hypothetical protein
MVRSGSSGVLSITISDVAQSRDAVFPPPFLQFHLATFSRLSSPLPPSLLLQVCDFPAHVTRHTSHVTRHTRGFQALACPETAATLPPRAQSIKGKLRAELEEALERERQLLLAQGDCNEDEEAENADTKASTKILVAEDVPWEDFVEVNFGRSAGQEKRERGRVAAVHIQRILRGYLVGWMLCHTSHVARHTSHVTRHTSHVTRHTSHVTRHTSHVTRHTSHVAGAEAATRRSCSATCMGKGKKAAGCCCCSAPGITDIKYCDVNKVPRQSVDCGRS